MNYIIYDLEFNQKYPKEMDVVRDNFNTYPFEIIQIGAIKLNKNLEIIDTFNSLIKPTIYPIIHPFIEELTNITNEKVSSCKLFKEVFQDFLKFIGNKNTVFLCCRAARKTKVIDIFLFNLSKKYFLVLPYR